MSKYVVTKLHILMSKYVVTKLHVLMSKYVVTKLHILKLKYVTKLHTQKTKIIRAHRPTEHIMYIKILHTVIVSCCNNPYNIL